MSHSSHFPKFYNTERNCFPAKVQDYTQGQTSLFKGSILGLDMLFSAFERKKSWCQHLCQTFYNEYCYDFLIKEEHGKSNSMFRAQIVGVLDSSSALYLGSINGLNQLALHLWLPLEFGVGRHGKKLNGRRGVSWWNVLILCKFTGFLPGLWLMCWWETTVAPGQPLRRRFWSFLWEACW